MVVNEKGSMLIGQDNALSDNELSSHEESVASPDEDPEVTPAKPLLKPVFLSKADRETLAQDQ